VRNVVDERLVTLPLPRDDESAAEYLKSLHELAEELEELGEALPIRFVLANSERGVPTP
jgi:hypothetical protein